MEDPDFATDFVPVETSRLRRFYEPVILLDALKSVFHRANRTTEPDLDAGVGRSPQQTYYCFLNKLSQICDNQPRQPLGKTVTAVVVLDSGTLEYRFASNQRTDRELDEVKEYLEDILNSLGRVTESEVDGRDVDAAVFSTLLLKVLKFNRPRIEKYIQALCEEDRLAFCIEHSATDGTNEGENDISEFDRFSIPSSLSLTEVLIAGFLGSSASRALQSLQPHIDAAKSAPLNRHDEFAHRSGALLQTIYRHYTSSLEEYMKRRTSNTVGDSPWDEVRHALGRLLSYFIAIRVLISARKLWPQLFVDFRVSWIPSSRPLAFGRLPPFRRTAEGILRRMGRNQAALTAYQLSAETLQKTFKLDARIAERVHGFRPIVHAETALLDSVLQTQEEGGSHAADAADEDGEDDRYGDADGLPARFFNEAEFGRYIGTSKPTCLLCRLYFDAHPAGVACRETHRNLYYNWRAPDVPRDAGPAAALQRQREHRRDDILESMIKTVRDEAARAVRDRTCARRRHDSRDTPSNPLWSTQPGSTVRGEVGEADWASVAGQVDDGEVAPGARRDAGAVSSADELAAMMGQVNLDLAPSSTPRVSGRSVASRETRRTRLVIEEDDDDDGGGGARL